MNYLPMKCDVCEQPALFLLQCMICAKKRTLFFVGHCCEEKHTSTAHPLEKAEYVIVSSPLQNSGLPYFHLHVMMPGSYTKF